jgi:hypothetical protein
MFALSWLVLNFELHQRNIFAEQLVCHGISGILRDCTYLLGIK